jgi:hypothetical protein
MSAMCVDMSAGAAVPGLTSGTSASALIALPLSFQYFGGPVTHYSVSSNGYLQLWPGGTGTPSTTSANVTMPNTALPNGIVAPFWDDLILETGATIRSLVVGSAGARHLVIEWANWRPTGSTGGSVTIKPISSRVRNTIRLHYCSMTATSGTQHTGSGATIGIENLTGTAASMQSHNTAGAVMTGSGFLFTPM